MQLQMVACAAKTIMILTKGFNYISVLKWYKKNSGNSRFYFLKYVLL